MNEPTVKIHKWLYPLSWVYQSITGIRNKLFDWKILKSKSFNLPVICIGNLSVGGTGKTPHTEYLVKLLSRDRHVAVLSRGYRRKTKGYQLADAQSTAATIGDEPYQIFTKFPKITVAVDEQRCRGVEQLMKRTDPAVDVVLLDDAFQHRYVKAGLNILLTDYHRLFCDDVVLPAGRLRESIQGKNRAHVVIVTKCPTDMKPIEYNIITKRMNLYPYQQLFFSTFSYGHLRPLFPSICDKELRLSALSSKNVLLVTGIASPQPMVNKLKRHAKYVELLSYADHHDFSEEDIQHIEERLQTLGKEKGLLVTTEKDATKLMHHPAWNDEWKPFLYSMPIEVEFLQNQQNKFNQYIINYVRENSRNRSLSERQNAHSSRNSHHSRHRIR